MSNKLYVGNLSYSVNNLDLESMFVTFGTVESATVITDRESSRSRGFGFVEMATEQQAKAAISAMHGKDIDGRDLIVNEAKPREDRASQARADRRY